MDEKDRKKALELIGVMLAGYPGMQAGINEATVEAYMRAVSNCSITAIEAACTAFLMGQVTGHDNNFPPTAPRLGSLAFALGEAAHSLAHGPRLISYRMGEQPPPGTRPLGGADDTWRGRHKTLLVSDKSDDAAA